LIRKAFLPALLALTTATACEGFHEAMTAHTDVLARAGGYTLTIDATAELLAPYAQIPAEPRVIRAVADLWVDYSLLATALEDDPTLAALDIDRFIQPERDEALIWRLREAVIQLDTTITDEDLEEAWRREGPGVEIEARHILLRIPAEPTQRQRDSLVAKAEELRQRALAGEDFAELASEYSEDPGSAQRGGDLGYFGRNRMVEPFEDAAFALEPGEVSDVVETPFGYHIIMVTDRRETELGIQRDDFRRQLLEQRERAAELAYLDSLTRAADIRVLPGAAAVVRQMARRGDLRTPGRTGERVLATFEGGTLTAADMARSLRLQPPQALEPLGGAADEQVEERIRQEAQYELLRREARLLDLEVPEEEVERIREEARSAIREVVRMAGLDNDRDRVASPAGPAYGILQDIVEGRRSPIPLGRLSHQLRDAYGARVNEGTFERAARRVEELRVRERNGAQEVGTP